MNENSPLIFVADSSEIEELIKRIYVKLGIQTLINDPEAFNLIINEMRESFGNYRIEEVDNALRLGFMGKLFVDNGRGGSVPVDMNLYNKPFNLGFLSTVMRAYTEIMRPVVIKNMKSLPEPKQKERSPEEIEKIILEGVTFCFEEYKKDKRILNYGNSTYNVLKDNISYPDDDFLEQAETIVKQNILNDKNKFTSIGDVISKMTTTSIERAICDLKLRKYFDELIEIDASPIDYLT